MATRRRPKRRKRRPDTGPLFIRIALTAMAVAALGFLLYVWWTTGDKLPPERVREIVLLSFSDAGIPATRVDIRPETDATVFHARATGKQARRFMQALKPRLKGSDARLHQEDQATTRIIRLTTGADRYRVELEGAGKGKTPVRKPTRYAETPKTTSPPLPKKLAGQPRVAVILDDVGLGRMAAFREALDIPYPITFAILPFRRFSRECAAMARGRGFDMIVHMPMEPDGYPKEDPGPGAVMERDNREKVDDKIRAALDNIMYARGMNNHMGSKITALPFTMRVILQRLKQEGLFFIDSRTTANTVVIREAEALGVPALSRDVFLDNARDPAAIRQQLLKAVAEAKKKGYVIAIGHNYPETVAVLKAAMPKLDQEVNFVFVRELIDELGR